MKKLPLKITIVRHAEKPKSAKDPNLAPKGYKRAIRLARYFKHTKFDYIFATKPHGISRRPELTSLPTCARFNKIPNTKFIDSQVVKLAKHILSGKYADKKILICWHHGQIPKLIKALSGIHIDPIDENVYNWVWHINPNIETGKLICGKQPF